MPFTACHAACSTAVPAPVARDRRRFTVWHYKYHAESLVGLPTRGGLSFALCAIASARHC